MSNQKTLNESKDEVLNLIEETKLASLELAKASTKDKDLLLKEISRQIEADYNLILEANKIDIKNANTKHLFLNAVRFDGDVSNWTITNPISLEQMFYNCYIFSGKGLSSWNIVTDSTYKDKGFQADDMFYACYELGRNVDIDLSSQARYKSFLDVYNYGK